jgi:alpha-ketoglutarate-dependent taurine dioxygenase
VPERPTSSMRVRPIAGHVGAQVDGVELAGPLSCAAVGKLRAALLRHKVLFFRDQPLSHDQHAALARHFGEVTRSVPARAAGDHPEILTLSPQLDRAVYGYDPEAHYRTRWVSYLAGWHTDVSHAVNPPAVSILRAEQTPKVGGDTRWTNLVAAYAGLSAPLQAFLDGLRAEHSFFAGYRMVGHDPIDRALIEMIGDDPMSAVHPVVRVHPETGERALFVNPSRTGRIVGLTPPESRAVLDLLFAQLARTEYTVRWRWRPGDVAMWDNRATAHLAPPDLDPAQQRVMHRVTIVGDRPVGPDGFRSEPVAGRDFTGLDTGAAMAHVS